MARLAGMGRVLLATTPVSWGQIEPTPPRGTPAYHWQALDDAILVWQLAGLDPILVLSPRSPWASMRREQAAWSLQVRKSLPPGEAAAALRDATGAAPPQDVRWAAWERFVGDVVERYDGDGRRDVPGLRRPLRTIQILDRVTTPDAWVGSSHQYLRLLHHARQGAKGAFADVQVATAALDVRATGHHPFPDHQEWKRRIREQLPKAPRGARIEAERAFEIAEDLLGMPQLFDVVTHVGAGHHSDDTANLRFLRRMLDEASGSDVGLWLVQNPTRKLDPPQRPDVDGPAYNEQRIRRRWLPAARNARHPDHARALAWLRRGQAYDVVRSVCYARSAGADAVLFLSPWDVAPLPAHRTSCINQGFVGTQPGTRSEARTPSWYALRQLNALLAGHRAARRVPIRGTGSQTVFSIPNPEPHPWVAVLLADAKWTWAGTPGETVPTRMVALSLPSGSYRIVPCQVGPDAPPERTMKSEDGVLRLALGPAPLYVLPTD